jgi:hypothetical protein
MIPTSGNRRKAQEKSPFPAGNRWKTEAVLRAERHRKIRKFSGPECCFRKIAGNPLLQQHSHTVRVLGIQVDIGLKKKLFSHSPSNLTILDTEKIPSSGLFVLISDDIIVFADPLFCQTRFQARVKDHLFI